MEGSGDCDRECSGDWDVLVPFLESRKIAHIQIQQMKVDAVSHVGYQVYVELSIVTYFRVF
jgi:hypothetical protein